MANFVTFAAALAVICAATLQVADAAYAERVYRTGDTIAPVHQDGLHEGYSKKAIGPAGWACTPFIAATPNLAYSSIRAYMTGGNVEEVNLDADKVVTWPVLHVLGQGDKESESELCLYLQKKDHCYPPTPNDGDSITTYNEHYEIPYYGRTFWGQVSTARLDHEAETLKTAVDDDGKTDIDLDFLYLAYYPDHVREVRFDIIGGAKIPPREEQPNEEEEEDEEE